MKNCMHCNNQVSLEQLFESKVLMIDNETENTILQINCPHCTLSILSSVDYPEDKLIKNQISIEWNERSDKVENQSCLKCNGYQNLEKVENWLIKQGYLNKYEYICEQSKYGKGCGLSILIEAENYNEAKKKIYKTSY